MKRLVIKKISGLASQRSMNYQEADNGRTEKRLFR